MPVTEATTGVDEQEFANYELAYHVLPTVTDGEVATVRDRVAAAITAIGGEVSIEEAPQHIELAYDIDKYLEGKHRKFSTAYFGWIRFQAERSQIDALTAAIDADKEILRYLLIRLTKLEEAMPFYFHESQAAEKKVKTVDESVEADIDPNAGQTEPVDTADVAETATVAADTDTEAAAADPEKTA